jgi:hypothetical protein
MYLYVSIPSVVSQPFQQEVCRVIQTPGIGFNPFHLRSVIPTSGGYAIKAIKIG